MVHHTIDLAAAATAALDPMVLSARAHAVWAKTGRPEEWLPLYQHMADTASVAGPLFDEWLSPQVKERWAQEPPGLGGMRTLAVFLAGVHDVGKASPAFVCQSEPLAERVRRAGLTCPHIEEIKPERKLLPHSLVSQAALTGWLKTRWAGQAIPRLLPVASVVGAHHGRPVTRAMLNEVRKHPRSFGDSAWCEVRQELIDWMAAGTGFDIVADDHRPLALSLPILVEITGFVIVADWLASNTRLFPLMLRDDTSAPDQAIRTSIAWDEIAMPPPWAPPTPTSDADEFYRERFGWPVHWHPHSVQRAVFEIASTQDIGCLCVETTTGGGKTEGALAAAELIGARRGSQGVAVALPTQATTNAMFHRVENWINHLPEPPVEVGAWALTLGHGKARLNQKFASLAEQAAQFQPSFDDLDRFAQMHESDDDPVGLCNAVVHQWFSGPKRRLLSNFAVVTIDQILMAGLQRRHLMLAHLALSGKVVVIDEAHASDTYMNVYLDSVLSWLGVYEVPVIVLSATLTIERRRELMKAYAGERADEIDALRFDPHDYPLVTWIPRRREEPIGVRVVKERGASRAVQWRWHTTDLSNIVDSVQRQLVAGGCALVVRNTVGDAQETARALSEAGIMTLLNHAGFLAADRAANDEELRQMFGPGGQRPRQAVVVATQVVEQSLDVDFDVLFTDLAPADLLLQRIGRLHRHSRVRPKELEQARAFFLADLEAPAPPKPTSGSTVIYGDHHLLRTAAALEELGPVLRLPEDVSPLVQRALGPDPIGPHTWQEKLAKAAASHSEKMRKQKQKAETWCVLPWQGAQEKRDNLGNWMATGSSGARDTSAVSDTDELQMGATVRDTEPSLEVVVVPLTPSGQRAIRPPWMLDQEMSEATETLDTSTLPDDDLAREIASWSVRLPGRMTRWGALEQVIDSISSDPVTKRWAWRQHRLLKSELLLPMNQMEEGDTTLHTELTVGNRTYKLRYSPTQGLEVTDA